MCNIQSTQLETDDSHRYEHLWESVMHYRGTNDFSPWFLFTADCHMKRRTWTNSTLLSGDATAAFRKMCANSILRDKNVDTIVIGGDLFDNNRPTSQDLLDVHQELDSFNRVFYLRGNHDSVYPPYVASFQSTDVRDDGFKYYIMDNTEEPSMDGMSGNSCIVGIPWVHSDSLLVESLKASIAHWRQYRTSPDEILYVVLHCSFKHLLGFDGAYQLDVDMIKELCGEDRINFLVGHIHTRDTLVYNKAGAYIHSPGSLYPLTTDKMSTPCFASLINGDTGEIIAIPVDVRKYVTVELSGVSGVNIIGHLNASGYQPPDGYLPTFVRLQIPEDYDQMPILESSDYVFKIDRHVTRQVTTQHVNASYTINDAVREELQNEANREMVIDMAEELLESDDPVQTLTDWLQFWKVRPAQC